MIQSKALEAIRNGRAVHISWQGYTLEASDLRPIGDQIFIETRHLNGEAGPLVPAQQARALERSYEDAT